jgi:hypothetical protein
MPWSHETRQKQAARIRERKPWEKSTGPRTAPGTARSSRNAGKGAWRPHLRAIARLIREFEHPPDTGAPSPPS